MLSDLNHDGKVDSLDLNEFVKQWGLELPKIKKAAKPAKAMVIYTTPKPTPEPVFTATPGQ